MSIDTARLRDLAEHASPGQWSLDIEREYGAYGAVISAAVTGVRSRIAAVVRFADDYGNDQAADGRYIAAADPPTILALLDRLALYERAIRAIPDWMHAGVRDYCPSCNAQGLHPIHRPDCALDAARRAMQEEGRLTDE